MIRDAIGRLVKDDWSPNFKMPSNFYHALTVQRDMFLLGNGVNWSGRTLTVDDSYPGAIRKWIWDDTNKDNPKGHYEWQVTIDVGTSDRLGKSFDSELVNGGKMAMDGAVSFGFWNVNHIEFFGVGDSAGSPAFMPIWDRFNGDMLMAGIRFWYIQTDTNQKTLYATLYEIDGITEYIWDDGNGRVRTPKRPYVQSYQENDAEGRNNVRYSNYKRLPIIPLWANKQHVSEIERLRRHIDVYDLNLNGIANDLSDEIIFWILQGAAGFDDVETMQFINKIRSQHVADIPPDSEVQPVPINPPIEGKSALLTRLEHDIYKIFSALNIDEIKGGAITATQIRAAYEDFNHVTDDYETQVSKFLDNLLELIGVEDTPTFTRSLLINVEETSSIVLQSAQHLSDEYVTKKILELLGDGDKFEMVQNQKQAEQMSRLQIAPADEDEESEEEIE